MGEYWASDLARWLHACIWCLRAGISTVLQTGCRSVPRAGGVVVPHRCQVTGTRTLAVLPHTLWAPPGPAVAAFAVPRC